MMFYIQLMRFQNGCPFQRFEVKIFHLLFLQKTILTGHLHIGTNIHFKNDGISFSLMFYHFNFDIYPLHLLN